MFDQAFRILAFFYYVGIISVLGWIFYGGYKLALWLFH